MRLIAPPDQPNCRRVLMFMAEKGITDVEPYVCSHSEVARFNPFGQVPVLLLEDGRCMSESISICRYLEHIYPNPCLFGLDEPTSSLTDMWQRRAEFELFIPALEYGHHTRPFFADFYEQHPQWAEVNRARVSAAFDVFELQMTGRECLMGDTFTVADITLFYALGLTHFFGIGPADGSILETWRKRISARPSARFVEQSRDGT